MLLRPKNIHTILLLLLLAGGVEAALLGLADWQYHRYHQRLQAAAQANATPITLSGIFQPGQTVALDNQPGPLGGAPGWRLLTPLVTASATLIVDRGWYSPPDRLTSNPDFTPFASPAGSVSLTGIWQPVVAAHGWLRGPLTTTSNRVFARLDPIAITSGTTNLPLAVTQIFQLTQPLPGQPAALLSQPSPTPDPLRHLSYMLQWLTMAGIFPLLCAFAWRKRR